MTNNLPTQQIKDPITPEEKAQQKKKNVKTIIIIAVIAQLFLGLIAGVYFYRTGYQNAKINTTNKIRQDAYNTVYKQSETSHHTSNRASIMLDGIREKADLDVLEIDTSYIYVSDEEDKARAQTIWYKIPGTGTYSIDLKMTEFIIDNDRQHVLVKAPVPAVTKFSEKKAQELEYRDDRFIIKGNVAEGETTARKMLFKAHTEMMKGLESNQEYLDAAESSARKLITNIIKSLNPSIDLTVTVEFAKYNNT